MKLTILCDNTTLIDQYFLAEPGFSAYIEDGERRVLFDTGYSGVFLQNAAKMGIDVAKADTLVLSHGHDDHTRGLAPLLREVGCAGKTLVAHPAALQFKRGRRGDMGTPYDAEFLSHIFSLQLTKEPLAISDRLTFLGEIPQYLDFEPRKRFGERFEDGAWVDDYIIEDSALALRGSEGISILTGCSHSGVCNIVEHTKRLFGVERIVSLIGGFHLREDGERAEKTADYLASAGIERLYPCHCTCFQCRALINSRQRIEEAGVGTTLEL